MTLIVEDGIGRAIADSYASLAAADARCASLGLTKEAP
ncbi:DnaT-like ssDNA-binding protein [Rugamonas rubra]